MMTVLKIECHAPENASFHHVREQLEQRCVKALVVLRIGVLVERQIGSHAVRVHRE
jgi:hypothetical protein